MVDSLSQRMHDELLQHDIDLLRVSASDERELSLAIEALTARLVSQLIRSDPTAVRRPFALRRLDNWITSARSTIRDAYRDMYQSIRQRLFRVARSEQVFLPRLVSESLNTSQRNGQRLVNQPTPRDVITDIIDTRSISANANDAARLREFFEREAASHHRRASGTLRQAFAQDESITQMVTRLRDLTSIQARESDAVIRTGYNHVVNHLRIETMQRNAHLFRGVVAVSVLDGRTSLICLARAGGMWDLNTGRPLPESRVQTKYPGSTPWHFNERTQLYPLTRSPREIARLGGTTAQDALRSLTAEQRLLLSPDPPAQETVEQWLNRVGLEGQNRALGPSRRKLWQDGKLSLPDLINQKGRPLRLDELAKRRERANA